MAVRFPCPQMIPQLIMGTPTNPTKADLFLCLGILLMMIQRPKKGVRTRPWKAQLILPAHMLPYQRPNKEARTRP